MTPMLVAVSGRLRDGGRDRKAIQRQTETQRCRDRRKKTAGQGETEEDRDTETEKAWELSGQCRPVPTWAPPVSHLCPRLCPAGTPGPFLSLTENGSRKPKDTRGQHIQLGLKCGSRHPQIISRLFVTQDRQGQGPLA